MVKVDAFGPNGVEILLPEPNTWPSADYVGITRGRDARTPLGTHAGQDIKTYG